MKTLVVMRHAKAEQSGPTDFERAARPTAARRTRPRPGSGWPTRGVEPDQALVSAAVRTQADLGGRREAAGWDLEARPRRRPLRPPAPRRALDLVRETDDVIRTLVVVGHNPTMASLAALLDDGEGDEEAGNEMALGLPDQRGRGVRVRRRLGGPRRGLGAASVGLPRGPRLRHRAGGLRPAAPG